MDQSSLPKRPIPQKLLAILFLFLFFTTIASIGTLLAKKDFLNNSSVKTEQKKSVLGYSTPQLFISGGQEGYSGGGMVSLASTDDPSVLIGSYNYKGKVDVAFYQANEQMLLDYLTHDKDGKQTKKSPDVSNLTLLGKTSITVTGSDGTKVALPTNNPGIYYLKTTEGSINEDSFVVRSKTGAIVKEGDNEYIFWGQDFTTKRSIIDGTVTLYDLQDGANEVGSGSFGTDGVAKTKLVADADIAVVQRGDDLAVIPVNLHYLNIKNYYSEFYEKTRQTKYFLFTDRPIYKPGDTVNFKTVLRDDDDARYTIPSGTATVKVSDGYGDDAVVYQQSSPITSDGTVSGAYTIPANAQVGYYTLSIEIAGSNSSSIYFDVEYYRKPDYTIQVDAEKTEYISGDAGSFTISGNYFSGQPLIGQKVMYKIYSGDYYDYEYLMDEQVQLNDDYRYAYYYGDVVAQGEVTLNDKGIATIPLSTKLPSSKRKDQVFSIEATIDNGSGNPAFSRKNVLIYAGNYDMYRKDYSSYYTKVNAPLSLPITLVSHNKTSVSNISLTAQVIRDNWVEHFDPNQQKYPTYAEEKEDLPDITARTDASGNAVFTFTPEKVGSYTFTVSGSDERGNVIEKSFYSYVGSDDQPYYSSGNNNGLTIQSDKKKYDPSDTAHLTIASTTPDRDIFLSLDRARVNRYQIVHMDGKQTTVDVPLGTTDMPNIYASVASFSSFDLDTNNTNLSVSTVSKELKVQVIPDRIIYGPSDTANITVKTTDVKGNPVSAEVALWGVDKAIYSLTNDSTGNIFDAFWSERYDGTAMSHSLESITTLNAEMGGGCFAEGTAILMADSSTKPIEKIAIGDMITTRKSDVSSELVSAKVIGVHKAVVPGYLIINNNLKVTTYHKIFLNHSWQEAANAQIDDVLTDSSGKDLTIRSIEWLAGKFTVYNLTVEKYNTFFANNIYVHNQKGAGDRTTFKDTAYWNSSIHTDSTGTATVHVKLPDNLTTWVFASVGSTPDTEVGQSQTEVVVTKDIIVRPILPNIMRVGDSIRLSALVQNFTDHDETFTVDLQFDAGRVKQATQSGVLIKAKEMKQLYWDVTPEKEADNASIRIAAVSTRDAKVSDAITSTLPVRSFGFLDTRAETGNGNKDFSVKLAPDSKSDKSNISLSLSPTLLGTLPTAMQYLVDYPYGCVEQTTSRLVPALIALKNPGLFPDALAGKDIHDIVDKGVSRLETLQHYDGGWPWWFGDSDPFITSYVVEYLLFAKDLGVDVNQKMLDSAKTYLEQDTYYSSTLQKTVSYTRDDIIAKIYGLTLLNDPKGEKHLTDLSGLSPDLLSLAVMANYKNGDTNPSTNGLTQLESMAQSQGDGMFWKAGSKLHFSSDDASTAFAMRAILLAKGNLDLVRKGARYLTRNRQYQYWSNTFATVQVIRAVTDLATIDNSGNPQYSYSVLLDGRQLSSGSVTSVNQTIPDITIPMNKIKPGGSTVSIKQNGGGPLYSTLLVKEFHTDPHAKAVSHGITVTRKYVNEKGDQYSLGIGDTVDVVIEVSGLNAPENYGVIEDQLPAGLIPINETFKNEQGSTDTGGYWDGRYYYADKEITENGAVLSLYAFDPERMTYSYRARVISEGIFIVPPATASLMYAPEIYGRSSVDTITVTSMSHIIPGKVVPEQAKTLVKGSRIGVGVGVAIFLIVLVFIILRIKGVTFKHLVDTLRKKKTEELPSEEHPNPPDQTHDH